MLTDISEKKFWCQLVFTYFNLYNEASRKYKQIIIQFFYSSCVFDFYYMYSRYFFKFVTSKLHAVTIKEYFLFILYVQLQQFIIYDQTLS